MAILINDVTPYARYTATAGQTLFTVPFEFFNESDLIVLVNDVTLTYSPTPADETQYSVTGANQEGGGSITLGAPGATLDDDVVIYRAIPIARSANYPETGPMAIASLNTEQAKHIGIMQQLQREADRALLLPLGEAGFELPAAADRASKVLAFDANGDLLAADAATHLAPLGAFGVALVANATAADARADLAVNSAAEMAGSGGAALIGTADGETLSAKLARNPIYIETYRSAIHADDTAATIAALAAATAGARPIVLKRIYDVSSRIDLPATGVVILGNGWETGFRGAVSGTNIILYGETLTGQVILKDFSVNGRLGGQADTGLIQFAGSADCHILCDNLLVENGGTPSAGPSGVNGIAVATIGYPSGPKSRIVIRNCHVKSTTKGGFNISTYAENVFLIGCTAKNIAGNGSAPGAQINGGRLVVVDGLIVEGTEGAGLVIGTVGTTPPLSSRAVLLDNILLIDCGQVTQFGGGYSSEGCGLFVSDVNSSPSGSATDASIAFGTIEIRNARQGGAVFSTGSGRIDGSLLIVDGSTAGISFQNISNVNIAKAKLINVNSRALVGASVAGIDVRGSSNITIDAEVWTRSGTAPDHLVYANTSSSSNLDITIRNRGTALVGQPIGLSTRGFIRDSRIKVKGEQTISAGSNAYVGYVALADGQTAAINAQSHSSGAAETATQVFGSAVRTTAGVAAIIGAVAKPVDIRSGGIATGLALEVDGSATCVRLFAAAGESTDFMFDYEVVVS